MEKSHLEQGMRDYTRTADGFAFGLIAPDQVTAWWEKLAPWIAQALEFSVAGRLSIGDVLGAARDGEMMLLLIGDQEQSAWVGVAVLQVTADGDGVPVINVVALSGSGLGQWSAALMRILIEIARVAKARRITATGRPGWARAMRQHGCVHRASVITFDIEPQARREG